MLTWEEFQKEKRSYEKVWDKLKEGFNGDIRKFLDKSYLVVAYNHGQVSFKSSEPYSIALESPTFFVPSARIEELTNLIKELNACDNFSRHNKTKHHLFSKTKIRKELEKFNPSGLSVKGFHVEVRFPSLKFDYI